MHCLKMEPSINIQEAYSTLDNAQYLYHIASSQIMNGELPRASIQCNNGESVDFVANDITSDDRYK